MEIGNVSAQLFNTQLPPDQNAAYTGCKEDFNTPYLTTCVDNQQSDISIEQAFQKQLSLSEAYKSPVVFQAVKDNYISKTMDHSRSTGEVQMFPQPPDEVSSQPPNVKLDFLKLKEKFGEMDGKDIGMVVGGSIMTLIGIIIISFMIYNNNGNVIDVLKNSDMFIPIGLIAIGVLLIVFGST